MCVYIYTHTHIYIHTYLRYLRMEMRNLHLDKSSDTCMHVKVVLQWLHILQCREIPVEYRDLSMISWRRE